MTPDPHPAPARGTIASVVIGGYLLAAIAAALVVRASYAGMPEPEISSGMVAFGMMLMYLVLFGGLALAHSGVLAWWLRGRARIGLVALAAVPAAMLSFVFGFFVMAA
ncbi:MAG: hypothetical protein HZB40_05320 [Rhodocyclales bacterium]|nr:hypothetical protein [Rhodocyclales bacterium]